jgi:hypothetical protein
VIDAAGGPYTKTIVTNLSTLRNSDADVLLSGGFAVMQNEGRGTLSNERGGRFVVEDRASFVQTEASTFVNTGASPTGSSSTLDIANGIFALDGTGTSPGTNLLRNEDGAQLRNAGNLVLKFGALLENDAALTNTQSIDVWASTLHNLPRGELENSKDIFLERAATLLNDGLLTDQGAIYIQRGSMLVNKGTLRVMGSIGSDLDGTAGPGELVNRGVLIVADGGAVTARIAAQPGEADVLNGTLVHGSWRFQTSSDHVAALTLLDTAGAAVAIDTIGEKAAVEFSGDGSAAFSQLQDHLRSIQGALSVGPGYNVRDPREHLGRREDRSHRHRRQFPRRRRSYVHDCGRRPALPARRGRSGKSPATPTGAATCSTPARCACSPAAPPASIPQASRAAR